MCIRCQVNRAHPNHLKRLIQIIRCDCISPLFWHTYCTLYAALCDILFLGLNVIKSGGDSYTYFLLSHTDANHICRIASMIRKIGLHCIFHDCFFRLKWCAHSEFVQVINSLSFQSSHHVINNTGTLIFHSFAHMHIAYITFYWATTRNNQQLH